MLHTNHIKANVLCVIDFYIEHLQNNYVMHTGNNASQAPMLIINLFAQMIVQKIAMNSTCSHVQTERKKALEHHSGITKSLLSQCEVLGNV